jgi:DNA-directed RNA polymerase specialized sigma subunit
MTINIKQRLKALQYIDIKAKSKHQEIVSLKSGILRGQQFDNMPKSKSNKNQSEELNILIIDKTEQLYQEIQGLYKERDELIQAIESLNDPVENIVMRLFYIDGLSWSQIQAQLRCGRGTIHRARESALKKISKKWN